PTMWTRPWTAIVPMLKSNEPVYEYACHEGNYAMTGILAGARASEKAAAEAAKKGPKGGVRQQSTSRRREERQCHQNAPACFAQQPVSAYSRSLDPHGRRHRLSRSP